VQESFGVNEYLVKTKTRLEVVNYRYSHSAAHSRVELGLLYVARDEQIVDLGLARNIWRYTSQLASSMPGTTVELRTSQLSLRHIWRYIEIYIVS